MPHVPAGEASGHEGLSLLGELAAYALHELQNVLQVITSSAFVAKQELAKGDAFAAAPHVGKVERNARQAHAIVNDFLALARGEPLRTELTPLVDCLEAARADLLERARFVDDVDPRDLAVAVQRTLFPRLLHALYENAVLASAPRLPNITVRARRERDRIVIDVSDDGPGVAPDLVPRLFDPLATGRVGGTGLGLSLARRIAHAHRGTLELVGDISTIRPTTRGGATFRVELTDVG
jgi:signal transduction histidine kinase